MSLPWELGVLTTGPPAKSGYCVSRRSIIVVAIGKTYQGAAWGLSPRKKLYLTQMVYRWKVWGNIGLDALEVLEIMQGPMSSCESGEASSPPGLTPSACVSIRSGLLSLPSLMWVWRSEFPAWPHTLVHQSLFVQDSFHCGLWTLSSLWSTWVHGSSSLFFGSPPLVCLIRCHCLWGGLAEISTRSALSRLRAAW